MALRRGRERHKEAGFLADKDERVPGAKAKYRQCNYMSEHSAPLSSHLLFSLSVDLKSYFGHYTGRLWLFVCLWAAAKISLVCLFWFRTRLSPGALWHRPTSLPTKSGSTIHSNQSQTRHRKPFCIVRAFWVGLAGSWVCWNYNLRMRRLPLFIANA